MLQNTRGIVLRTIKYGETSLICSIFTETFGIQSYLVKGVRSSKSRGNKAGLLQTATILDMVVYHKPDSNLQHIKEYRAEHIYQHVQSDIVKNSVALFSSEMLLRLLPEHAPLPELFDFCFQFLVATDKASPGEAANLPLYFVIHCARHLGYDIDGSYSLHTPYLNLSEGAFTGQAPAPDHFLSEEDTHAVAELLMIKDLSAFQKFRLNGAIRFRLLDWFVAFLQHHTQHLSPIRSLPVLRAILHG